MKSAALFLLLVLVPTPAQASPSTAHWSTGRVQVVDEVAATVGFGGVQRWRALRDKVLNVYAAAGFEFVVTERQAGPCAKDVAPGAVLLCRDSSPWGWPGGWDSGPEHIAFGVAAIVHPRPRLRSWPTARIVLCHEFGHALGLGHNTEGCMATAPLMPYGSPSPSDLAALSAAREHQD